MDRLENVFGQCFTYYLYYFLFFNHKIYIVKLFRTISLSQSSRESVCTYERTLVSCFLRSQMQTNPPVSSVAGNLYVISSCELRLFSTLAGLSL